MSIFIKNLRAIAFGLCGILFPLSGNAMVLGNLSIQSFLGQPLRAYLPFSANAQEAIDNSCVTLQAPGKRDQYGTPYLTKARLTVENLNGRQRVVITTRDAVNEPAMIFQLQIACSPDGTFTREFTVLLDPPEYAQLHAPVTGDAQSPKTAADNDPASSGPAQPILGERYEVLQEQTLENMARSLFPKSRSMRRKFVAATIRDNPDIFKEQAGDAVQAGATLRLPTRASLLTGDSLPENADKNPPAPVRAKKAKVPAAHHAHSQNNPQFELKLSTGELDLTANNKLSAQERDMLRERQLLSQSDDQVATLLSMKNQIKLLEGRLSELQLKLSSRIAETDRMQRELDQTRAGLASVSTQHTATTVMYWIGGSLLLALFGYGAFAWFRNRESPKEAFVTLADNLEQEEEPASRQEGYPRRATSGININRNTSTVTSRAVNKVEDDIEHDDYNPQSIFQKDDLISLTEFDSVIDEADLYLVYGWQQKAIDLLKNHIQHNKTEVQPWIMLGDIYRSNRLFKEYENLATEFKELFGESEWWNRMQAMGRELDPNNPLYQNAPIPNVELPLTEQPTSQPISLPSALPEPPAPQAREEAPPEDTHALANDVSDLNIHLDIQDLIPPAQDLPKIEVIKTFSPHKKKSS